ncbi:AfsR/SARP family transcriptional regulator [Nocardia sp. KC 131]|uniref:AfsR/SARP family transcriptional regulator n=1 Tax=Nocardia arseniciresistens TaxID=3392119 RepID=UPI00398F4ABD
MTTWSVLLAYDDHGMFPDQNGHDSRTLTTPAGESVVVALLGEIALHRNGALAALPGARSRLLLAALALHPGRSRSAQALIEDVWGEQPPRAPMNALHTQVSRLRSGLPEGALEIGPAGYRLILRADQVDLTLADELVREARRCQAAGDLVGCSAAVARARSLWRGEPGADLPAGEMADELRTAAAQRLAELETIEVFARVAGGDIDGAVAITRRAAAANPLDEAAHATLMRLLATAGRSNEALDVFASIRGRLVEELGADPGSVLVELNTAILRGDPVPGLAVGSNHPMSSPHNSTSDGAVPSGSATDSAAADSATGDLRNSAAQITDPVRSPSAVAAIGLRAPPNALLGRAADLEALAALLHRSRVTTVLGPGGTGKTRVANELGARVARAEPVVLVELASVRADAGPDADPRADIEAAISTMLGLGEIVRESALLRPARPVNAGRRLRDALSARPMLLILDNCEHLIDAVAEVVADLVGSCDQLSVLTTSRAPLAITAETVYPLLPLAIDAGGSPATDLFMARARAVRPTVRLEPEVVARLCGTLDGLPLAIELAAARVRTMSVEEIETRLEHRFALLRSGDRSSPERHRTLHAVIAWSWNLLEEPQQIALRRLCRFPAGFTLAAAEVVAGGPDVDDVPTAVDGLVSQSLLTVLEDAEGLIGTRYRMLETVREFGEEQLTLTGSEAAAGVPGAVDERLLVMDRMSRWARDFSLTAARRYRTDAQVSTVLAVAADLDNLVAVLRYALERRDARTVYRVFPVVATLWVMRGAHMELSGWARRVITLAPEPGRARGLVADLQMFSHLVTGLHLVYMGNDLRAMGTVRARTRRLLSTAIDLNSGARFLGVSACAKTSGAGMARLFADAVRSADPDVRAAAYFMRANVRENAGQVYGSTQDALAALRLVEDSDVWGTAMISQHLGQLAGQTARYADSMGYYRRTAELMRELRAHEEVVEMRCLLAVSLVGMGELEQARKELGFATGSSDADQAHAPIDDPGIRRNHRLAPVVSALAELELAEGDIEAGFRHYRRSLELYGWPEDEPTPGPDIMMTSSAAIAACVLHGRPEAAEDIVRILARHAAGRLGQFYDLPQIGAVANAVGSYHLATEQGSSVGLELLALSTKVVARQDYPSTELRRHHELHRAAIGAERMDEALGLVAGLRRRDAAERILRLLRELSGITDD